MDKTFIDKLAFIYLKDRKILCTRSKGKDTWYIPGGKREQGESDYQALIREVKEELSVDIVSRTISSYGIFEAQAHGKPEGTTVRMSCYQADFTGLITASSEIAETAYFSTANINKTSQVDHLIFADLQAKGLID